MSPNSDRQTVNDDKEQTTHNLIRNAVRLARTGMSIRIAVRDLITELDRQADIERYGDPSDPPEAFRAALRRPVGSKRKTITVLVDGERIALLLNPQGRTDPQREKELWTWIRNRVAKGVAA